MPISVTSIPTGILELPAAAIRALTPPMVEAIADGLDMDAWGLFRALVRAIDEGD